MLNIKALGLVVSEMKILTDFVLTRGLNRSLEFCLKLTYRYLLKAGHVPGHAWDGANFGPGA